MKRHFSIILLILILLCLTISCSRQPNWKNAFQFHQLLFKHNVTAYYCGHTRNASYSYINGLWQLDSGHSREIEEDSEPNVLFNMVSKFIKKNDEN